VALRSADRGQSSGGIAAAVGAAVVGALLVLTVGGALWFFLGGDTDTAESLDTTTFSIPDGPAVEVPASRITVSASSFLPPDEESGLSYGPDNLIDGDLTTAWNSVTSSDQGVGETLTFRFTEPVDLKTIKFVNGYTKNDTVYLANHRVQDMRLTTDATVEGEPIVVELLDIMQGQEIQSDFGLTSKVELEITGIFPGDGFLDEGLTTDLALTEITFFAVQR
jgi:hypothetical protein